MSRYSLLAGMVWLTASLVLVVGAASGAWPHIANAYLCGWLVLVSLPLGALPILMALEIMKAEGSAVAAPLRLLLASLPILALLFVPLLIGSGDAYTWQGCHLAPCPSFHFEGLGARWFRREFFTLRSVIYLALWFGLSLYFLRPARRSADRHTLAVAGLVLHAVIGTLAAFDWFMSLDDGHVSANYGLVVMAAQCAFALTAALLILLLAAPGRPERRALHALLVVIGIATFVQFAEFLVVWSANLPKEIAWYQDRAVGGRLFAVVGPMLLAFGVLLLASERASANRLFAASALGMFLIIEVVDLVLVTSPNGLFVPNFLADILMIIVLGGLAVVCAAALGGRNRQRLTNG